MQKKIYDSSTRRPVAIAGRPRGGFQHTPELKLEMITDPEIAGYIQSLKKEYQKYSMPIDEARKVVDTAMGEKTLTSLLYEARGRA